MDLKIKDVAELLSVSETTIRRWLTDGKIPAYKLNSQYRFSRIEIENWMLSQKLPPQSSTLSSAQGETQIFPLKNEEATQQGNQQYSLYRAVNRGGIFSHVPGSSKEVQNIPFRRFLF